MHFIGVLFSGDEDLLEKYWEGLEVDEYVSFTKDEIIDRYIDIRKSAITWRKKRIAEGHPESSEYQEWLNENPRLNKKTAWDKIKKDYEGHIDKDGNILSSYNPDSQWDWYSVGGRWSGYFPLNERDQNGDIVWVDEAEISEIDWEEFKNTRHTPYCYITEEGDWVAKGDIGWFSSTNETEASEWEKQFYKELKSYPLDTPVKAIDFHI